MNRSWGRYLAWHARHGVAYLHWPGVVGIVVLIVSAAFYWQVQRPQEDELRHLNQAATRLQSRVAPRQDAPVARTPEAQLAQFYAYFPDAKGEALTDALSKIYAAAAAANLTLDQGDYRLAPEVSGQLVRYDIAFPVKGNYPHLRKFLAQVLKDVPNLALEGIIFNRQAAVDIGVDAQLRFTLYLRDDASANVGTSVSVAP